MCTPERRGDHSNGAKRGLTRPGAARVYDPRMTSATLPHEVTVAPVTWALADAARAVRVEPAQYAYVGEVAVHLIDCEASPHSEPMAILAEGVVVGFYRIDLRPGAIAGGDYGGACALLRNLQVDRTCQGRGLGTLAVRACVADLERRHLQLRLLALTVSCVNATALQIYRRTGFVDSGRFYYGGRSGPQHLMFRRLGPEGVGESAA